MPSASPAEPTLARVRLRPGSREEEAMSLERTPFVSRVVRVTRGSESLRVTIPQVVASTMGLRPGDQVAWSLESSSPVVRVRRLPGGSGDPAPEAER